jgi:hypothetical protein
MCRIKNYKVTNGDGRKSKRILAALKDVSCFMSLRKALSRDIPTDAGFLCDKAAGPRDTENRHLFLLQNWAGGTENTCHVSTAGIWVGI